MAFNLSIMCSVHVHHLRDVRPHDNPTKPDWGPDSRSGDSRSGDSRSGVKTRVDSRSGDLHRVDSRSGDLPRVDSRSGASLLNMNYSR